VTADAAPRLLVVDDDEGLLILMADALAGEGYRVDTANTGRGALQQIEAQPPDLMLLDLKLTDVESGEIMARLTRSEARVPFVIVTGQGGERVAADVPLERGRASAS